MIVGNSCGFNAGNEKFFVRDECYRYGCRVCDVLTKWQVHIAVYNLLDDYRLAFFLSI